MFPIKDNISSSKFPFITLAIIIVNVYVFIQEIFVSNTDKFVNSFALTPSHVMFSNPQTLIPFVTALFLHSGFIHILSNMWFLWVFGDNVEDYIGKIPFILLYFAAGIAGNILQFVLDPSSSIPMLGASGAISGILGAYFVLFPGAKIKSVVFLFFLVTFVDIPAFLYLLYWFVIQVFSGASSFGNFQGGVAFWAHVGGFVTGYFVARAIKDRKGRNYIEGEIVG